MSNDHELRTILNDEIHGRAGTPISAPARLTHLAFTTDEQDGDPLRCIMQLADAMGVKQPAPGSLHHFMQLPDGFVRYEKHGEFYRVVVLATGRYQKAEAIAQLPLGWIDSLPGKRLVAIHTHVYPTKKAEPYPKELKTLFGHEDLAASLVSVGRAAIWTDFRIGPDGYTRILVHDLAGSPLRLGRVLRRIHEIETYRMMALLALPVARAVQRDIGELEKQLTDVIGSMLSEGNPQGDSDLLMRLSSIARNIEDMSNRTSYRFAATKAYADLVRKRVDELAETRVSDYHRIGVFLDRRFSPAMSTCHAVYERINSLAQRSERASNLLRTRVDIALEAQNQALLRSMEKRAKQQLMLQETVEGLSVVVISYYVIGIAGKFIEGLGSFFPAIDAKLLSWIVIPPIVGLVWYFLRRLRSRIHKNAGED